MASSNQNVPRAVNMLHNSFRFGGVNTPFNFEDGFPGSTEMFTVANLDPVYFFGLFTPLNIMIVFVVIWTYGFVNNVRFGKTCCCKNLFVAQCAFFFQLSVALLCFIISIKGVKDFKEGSTDGFNSINSIVNLLSDSSTFLEGIASDLDNLRADIDSSLFNCGDDEDINNLIPDFGIFADNLQFVDVVDLAGDISSQFQDIEETTEVIVTPMRNMVNLIISIIILYLCTFMFVSYLAFFRKSGKRENESCASRLRRRIVLFHNSVGWILFLFSSIIIAWSVLAVSLASGFFGMLGADNCASPISTSILTFVTGETDLNATLACDAFAQEIEDDKKRSQYLFCHYLFCEGDNVFLDNLNIQQVRDEDEVLVRLESPFFLGVISNVQDAIAIASTNEDNPVCTSALQGLEEEIQSIHLSTMLALEGTACDTLTPTIEKILATDTCNGIVSGFSIVFICWLSGSIFMLLSVNAYFAMMFHKPKSEEVPRAEEIQNYSQTIPEAQRTPY